MNRRLAALVTLSLAVAGTAAAIAQDAGSDAGRSPEEERRRAQVLVRFGDVRITVGDVDDRIAEQSPFVRGRYNDPSQRRELLDNLIRFELLAKEARRRGYDRDPEVVQAVKQVAVQELIRRDFDERIRPDTIPADDVRAHYEKNASEFHRPEMRRISQIVLATREEATRLLDKVRTADARAFRQLAQEHSIDRETKLRGGDVRYFPQVTEPGGEAPPVPEPVVHAAFGLENIGDVTREPVEISSGRWALVKLTGRRPADHRTLEQAEPSIRNRLWRERRQSSLDEFVADLRRRANVQVHEELLNLIVLSADDQEAIPGLGAGPGGPRVRATPGAPPGRSGPSPH